MANTGKFAPKKLWLIRIYVLILQLAAELILLIYILESIANMLSKDGTSTLGNIILGSVGIVVVALSLGILFLTQLIQLFVGIYDNIQDIRNKTLKPDLVISDTPTSKIANSHDFFQVIVIIISLIVIIIQFTISSSKSSSHSESSSKNPSVRIKYNLGENKMANVVIYNTSGKEVKEYTIYNTSNYLLIDDLPIGTYRYQIYMNNLPMQADIITIGNVPVNEPVNRQDQNSSEDSRPATRPTN